MARELTFKIKRKEYKATPMRVDRRKLYGWTEIIALDEDGEPCKLLSTDESGAFIIPRGGTGLGIVTSEGLWVDRSDLVSVNPDGSPAELLPSSYSTVINLTKKVTQQEFLNHSITAFYELTDVSGELIEAVGENIYTFSYCYVEDCEGSPAFVLQSGGGKKSKSIFLLVGVRNIFEMLDFEQPGFIDDFPDEIEDGTSDEIDFSMF